MASGSDVAGSEPGAVEARLRELVRDVPDFPKPGIVFKDLTPVLESAEGFRRVVDAIAARWRDAGITRVVGIESRGFIFGAAVAYALGVGLVLVRKPGKLPRASHSATYELEYGEDRLEMHTDAVTPDDRVLIVDDVLATGGTAAAVGGLVRDIGATLSGYAFVVELAFLDGRSKLPEDAPMQALVAFD